jgi:6-phosphogluconolactonase (cycloisomerase 2 family)
MKVEILIAAAVLSAMSTLAGTEVNNLDTPGAVFTMNNSPNDNRVLVFNRDAHGTLSFQRSVSTGGRGSGAGLGNQGALALSQGNQWLFVVNAGSHEISSLAINPNGLSLIDRVDSGGLKPSSITVSGNVLYVLNAGGDVGGTDNITGFVVDSTGHLHPLAGSTRELSAPSTGPAEVGFSSDGNVLVVTEKNTSLIDTFTLDEQGIAGGHQVFASPGQEPFGFAFDKRNHLFVTEAPASTVSSYSVAPDGTLSLINTSVQTHQNAACWMAVTKNGRYAYAANAASSSVSGFSVQPDGSIGLLKADGLSGSTSAGPNDIAMSANSHFLYTVNASNGTISEFAVDATGNLTALGNAIADTGVNGLVAY